LTVDPDMRARIHQRPRVAADLGVVALALEVQRNLLHVG
jgi:hypothetical protein